VRFQPFSALFIILNLLIMQWAVQLDDQIVFGAAKIDDKRPDGMLPPEIHSTQLIPTQTHPQNPLRIGLCLTKFSRSHPYF